MIDNEIELYKQIALKLDPRCGNYYDHFKNREFV